MPIVTPIQKWANTSDIEAINGRSQLLGAVASTKEFLSRSFMHCRRTLTLSGQESKQGYHYVYRAMWRYEFVILTAIKS